MATIRPELDKLPELQRFAMWHSETGLIVSPLGRMLPENIARTTKACKRQDYTEPRLLEDSNIYLAFYPNRSIHESPLFADMGVDFRALENSVLHVPGTVNMFKLDVCAIEKWTHLENGLCDLIMELMSRHPGHQRFPQISWPRWPYLHGYRDAHEGVELAIACAKQSLWAFTLVSACMTFALSLWLGEFEQTCFHTAFSTLANRTHNSIPRTWLETFLRESTICNLSPGLRTGGFLDPFITQWRPFIPQFCRARTPIWFIWGKGYRELTPEDPKMSYYLPPEEYVRLAQRQKAHFSTIILPQKATYKHEGPLSTVPASGPPVLLPNDPSELPLDPMQDEPDVIDVDCWEENPANPNPTPGIDRSLIVFKDCDQLPGENWEAFKSRMQKGLEKRKRIENPVERQSREAREAVARGTDKKSGGPHGKCTGFIWEQDEWDKTFYRRTSVRKNDLLSTFREHHDHQRFYWSHVHQWDFVPHLPSPPGVTPSPRYKDYDDPDDDDVDWEGEAGTDTMQQPPGGLPWPGITKTLLAISESVLSQREKETQWQWVFQDIGSYLLYRHGFDDKVDLNAWKGLAHVATGPLDRKDPENHKLILRYLLYDKATLALPGFEKLVDFYNTLVDVNTTCSELPPYWDISKHLVKTVECDFNILKLERVMNGANTVYLLRPPNGSEDDVDWFIALHSATAVLSVYRNGWKTMTDIARGLLETGISFRTVVERTTLPPKNSHREYSLGLGVRPYEHKVTREDLAEYTSICNNILRSTSGRALRLRGGIVGRIAGEVVPDLEILQGPSYCDEIVARHGDKYYLDDGISEELLEKVCGVYYLATTDTASDFANISWWPKQSTWETSGFFGDQWSPVAEAFYQSRNRDLKGSKLELRRATKWRSDIRFHVGKTKLFIDASERLAAEFLSSSDRVGTATRRVPPRNM